jgi:hypothetical protein
MLRPGEREISSATAEELGAMTGAAEFADVIAQRVERSDLEVSERGSDREEATTVTPVIRSGVNLHDVTSFSEVVVLTAVEHETQQLRELAVEVAGLQAVRPSLTPVFLIGNGSPLVLTERGFAFEAAMTQPERSLIEVDADYAGYLRRLVRSMLSRYGTDHLVEVKPDRSFESQMPRAITNR